MGCGSSLLVSVTIFFARNRKFPPCLLHFVSILLQQGTSDSPTLLQLSLASEKESSLEDDSVSYLYFSQSMAVVRPAASTELHCSTIS